VLSPAARGYYSRPSGNVSITLLLIHEPPFDYHNIILVHNNRQIVYNYDMIQLCDISVGTDVV